MVVAYGQNIWRYLRKNHEYRCGFLRISIFLEIVQKYHSKVDLIVWASSYSLLVCTRSRGRCWAVIRLFHRPEDRGWLIADDVTQSVMMQVVHWDRTPTGHNIRSATPATEHHIFLKILFCIPRCLFPKHRSSHRSVKVKIKSLKASTASCRFSSSLLHFNLIACTSALFLRALQLAI